MLIHGTALALCVLGGSISSFAAVDPPRLAVPGVSRSTAGQATYVVPAVVPLGSERTVPEAQIKQIRQLSQERAAQRVPIRIKGVVTALSGWKNSFFIQDSTAGISVDRTDSADVKAGDEVEVTGSSSAGLFAPLIMASYVRVIRHSSPPRARRVTYGDILGGEQDSQWIEVMGIVHSARMSQLFERETLFVTVELGGGSVQIYLKDFAGMDYSRLVDSAVRVRGVCSTTFNEKRQVVGLGMFVPDRRDIEVVSPAAADPFTMAALSIRNTMQFGQGSHRVKISGIATHQIPGSSLYLQDGSDGIRIQTLSKQVVEPGTIVEAVGFPRMGEYAPILDDGVFRIVGHTTPIVPLTIDAKDAITTKAGFIQAPYDEQLVRIQGEVVESHIQGGERVWIFRQDHQTFEGHLPLSAATDRLQDIDRGSILLLVGICTVHTDPSRNPTSFGILLRSPKDIVVLRQTPWWTPVHFFLLLAILAAAMSAVILWVVILRHRVEQQTRIIRESEARFRDLARHDGLTGLLNRNAILSAFDVELERGRRENKTLALVLVDIDHFKQVNDTHGHLAGDSALRQFAAALAGQIRSYDHVGRYGGEEFLLVLSGILASDVEKRLASLHYHVTNLEVRDHEAAFRINCSMGALIIDPTRNEIKEQAALSAADLALYQAKAEGRNRVVCHALTGGSAVAWAEKPVIKVQSATSAEPMATVENAVSPA